MTDNDTTDHTPFGTATFSLSAETHKKCPKIPEPAFGSVFSTLFYLNE